MPSSPDTSGVNGVNGFFGHNHGHGRNSPSGSRSNLSISLPFGPGHERSVASLEKEIMRLQEVLKDRETEICQLENTLREKDSANPNSEALPNGHAPEDDLEPQIKNQIAAIRRSMEVRHPQPDETVSPTDETDALDRLNEIML